MKEVLHSKGEEDFSIARLRNILEKRCESTLGLRRSIYALNRKSEGMTLEEIGKNIGVSKERVRQILKKSYMLIRHPRVLRKCYIYYGQEEAI